MTDTLISINEEKWNLLLTRINELKYFVEKDEYGKKKSFYAIHKIYDKITELDKTVKSLASSIHVITGEESCQSQEITEIQSEREKSKRCELKKSQIMVEILNQNCDSINQKEKKKVI